MIRSPDDLSSHAVARLLGMGISTLHWWERRYGWPRPLRGANGYGVYPPALVVEIERVVALVRSGHRIADLIGEGSPRWPAGTKQDERLPAWAALARLPEPAAPIAAEYRARLLEAAKVRNAPTVARMLHQAVLLLRRDDRLLAAWAPAYLAAAEWRRVGRPLAVDVEQLVRLLAGDEVLANVRARAAEPGEPIA